MDDLTGDLTLDEFLTATSYIRAAKCALTLARMIRVGDASCRHVHPARGSCPECYAVIYHQCLSVAAEQRQRLAHLLRRAADR